METFWIVALVGFFSLIRTGRSNEYSHYTPEELLTLKQVRSQFKKEFEEYKGPYSTDGYLIHILRARNGDAEAAIQMARDILKWRTENNIDNVLSEDFSKFKKLYPYWIDHASYAGEPIATVPAWDIRKIMLGGYREYVIRYIDRIFEEGLLHALNASKMAGKEITQGIIIFDLSAYSARTHACLACMPFYTDFIYHFENYYPQATSTAFLVNTPRIFTSLLEIIRPLMSEYTRSNLKIFGVDKEEYRRELLKVIPIERVRTQLGGKLHD